ncbi:MAG: hypothetical protein MZV65_02300 [Chromatiales bacterium]|nr:hypothetical protein [Chromatiales bacterium]
MNPMLALRRPRRGEVTERSFARMVAKPDWGIRSIVGEDGQDHLVDVKTVVEKPFGNLIQFFVRRRRGRWRARCCWSRPCRATTPRCCARRCSACCRTATST